jgi:hypothetical protein
MVTSAGILSFHPCFAPSKAGIHITEYKCTLECGEDELTKSAKAKEPIWESHKVWDGLAEKWGMDPEIWKCFRVGCKKAFIEGQKKADEEKEAPGENNSELMKKVREKALDIMQHGDPIQFIMKTIGQRYLGNEDNVKVYLSSFAVMSVKNSRGLHIGGEGSSGMGKTSGIYHTTHCLTPSAYLKLQMSPKALLYHEIHRKTMLIISDYKQNDDTDGLMKQTTSDFHSPCAYKTVINGEPVTLEAPPEIVWCVDTVQSSQDIQVINRQFSCPVDESAEIGMQVVHQPFQLSVEGEDQYPINEDVLICRAMSEMVHKADFKVVVPYGMDIKWGDSKNRRNSSIFLDLLFAQTMWHFMQRGRDEHGNLVATVADYDEAVKLYSKRAEAMMDKLNGLQRQIVKLIAGAPNREIYLDDIVKALNEPKENVRLAITGKKNKNDGTFQGGLTQKLPGFLTNYLMVVHENGKGASKKMLCKLLDTIEAPIEIVKLENHDQWALLSTTKAQPEHNQKVMSSSRGTTHKTIDLEREPDIILPQAESELNNVSHSFESKVGCASKSALLIVKEPLVVPQECPGCAPEVPTVVPEDTDSEKLQCSREIVL